ncbi:hypothetical protein [Acidimangrovimonas sediminis]|uniref:hypothetical protein n=1 Tax=Acidimangrovimonas sediminis TaxID=2056283 RepID=UPI000C80FEF3|nr:hypothetical protein [Acidimangrovimonas sediminis]
MKRPTLLPVTVALCLSLGSLAMAGAPDNTPRPELRPAAGQDSQPVAQPATLTTDSEKMPVLNPWGAKRYERVWRTGDKIGQYNFRLLTAWKRYDLPSLPQGQVYVALGRQILTVNARDWVVVASVGDISAIIG